MTNWCYILTLYLLRKVKKCLHVHVVSNQVIKTYESIQHGYMNIRRVATVAMGAYNLLHVRPSRLSDFLLVSAHLLLDEKDKTTPVQACTVPVGSTRLRLPEFLESRHMKW